MLEQQRRAQAISNSGKTLEKHREQRLEERSDSRRRALLSLAVPFFGLGNQLYELLLTSRRYHREGDPRDAVAVAFGAVFLATSSLLLTFVPGPKLKTGEPRPSGAALDKARVCTACIAQRSGSLARLCTRPSCPARYGAQTPGNAFASRACPEGAIALKGAGGKVST